MNDALFDLRFRLRYAVRVLERQARFWRHVEGISRFLAFLSGTAAFAAIISSNSGLTIAFGVLFAALQGVDFVFNPAAKAAEAREAGKVYAEVLAGPYRNEPEQLEQALLSAQARDDVVVFEALREPAYNDVAKEMGCEAQHYFKLNCWQRVMSAIG